MDLHTAPHPHQFVAQFEELRHCHATPQANCAMDDALLESIRNASAGSMLAELLAQHPDVARRTAQRWISQWIDGGQITVIGKGRARRYFLAKTTEVAATAPERDRFPGYIPLSAGVAHRRINAT